ncbi:MAG: DEAD/DEAH box helicase family protein [Chloroflexi bacterium]|nr:DEAD/DEAH box helicase family protein [Chloroflexota bacterium]
MRQQQSSVTTEEQPDSDGSEGGLTKSAMQDEAVEAGVRILRKHAQSNSDGIPVGEARGKIILPCGTGKTRISLRIVEELTPAGELSIVLCPSIALVAQIRREYLQHRSGAMRVLAVCSDATAGYDKYDETDLLNSDDPFLDKSSVSANDVKGLVTTDAGAIAEWIEQGMGSENRSA